MLQSKSFVPAPFVKQDSTSSPTPSNDHEMEKMVMNLAEKQKKGHYEDDSTALQNILDLM